MVFRTCLNDDIFHRDGFKMYAIQMQLADSTSSVFACLLCSVRKKKRVLSFFV